MLQDSYPILKGLPYEIILIIFKYVNLHFLIPLLEPETPDELHDLKCAVESLLHKEIRITELLGEFGDNLKELHYLTFTLEPKAPDPFHDDFEAGCSYSAIYYNTTNYRMLLNYFRLQISSFQVDQLTIAGAQSINQILDDIRTTPQLKCKHVKINFQRNKTSITLPGGMIESISYWRFNSEQKYTTVTDRNSVILDFYSLTDKKLSIFHWNRLQENSMNELIQSSSQHNSTIWSSDIISYGKLKLETNYQKDNTAPVDLSSTASDQFSNLKHLTVSFNITPILLNSFSKLEHLEFVNLKDVIDLDINLPRLKTLRLSDSNIEALNMVESLTEIEVENCKELRKLNLGGNLQESLKRLFVVNCKKLEICDKLPCNLRDLSIGNGLDIDKSIKNVSFSHLDKLTNLKLFTNGSLPPDLPHTIEALHLMTTAKKLWYIGRHQSLRLPDNLQTLIIENGFLAPTTTPDLHFSDFSSQLQNVKLVNVVLNCDLYLEQLTKTEILNCRFINSTIQIDSRSVFVSSGLIPITKLCNCWHLYYWSYDTKAYSTKRLHNLLESTAAIRNKTDNGVIEVVLSRHAEMVEKLFRQVKGVVFRDLKLYDIRVSSDLKLHDGKRSSR